MRILLVEDERKIANFIERGLKEERYIVEVAYDGEKALGYSLSVQEKKLFHNRGLSGYDLRVAFEK